MSFHIKISKHTQAEPLLYLPTNWIKGLETKNVISDSG